MKTRSPDFARLPATLVTLLVSSGPGVASDVDRRLALDGELPPPSLDSVDATPDRPVHDLGALPILPFGDPAQGLRPGKPAARPVSVRQEVPATRQARAQDPQRRIEQEWAAELEDFDASRIRKISGIYPHLAAFNRHGECGIGAVVPWANRLWWITYPPHFRQGSSDRLYSIDRTLRLAVHAESVGGTHAARMIHRPSGQLLIGPYAIDRSGRVRAMDVRKVPGRYTAWAAHLKDPSGHVYLFDMEGPIWEVDVQTLAARRLFVKPVPGWHGKGAYSGQGRLVIANNGESGAAGDLPRDWELPASEWPRGEEAAGALAEYDGETWHVVRRRQFVEVTGPGGIGGNDSAADPLWAMGWDRRSVLLLSLDASRWSTFRLPKASHTMDPRHGWYTEWPRIRPVSDDAALLCMHGMFYDFPLAFSSERSAGIRPLCSHLRYVPDFCRWEGRLVLAADDTSILQNAMAGQSQSNLWFGTREDLQAWGPGLAFGGPWLGDRVEADTPSDPYLFAGFSGRMVHLATGGGDPVTVSVEIDRDGHGSWSPLTELTIPTPGYLYHLFSDETPGEWIRFRLARSATVSAYLHYRGITGRARPGDDALFASLRPGGDPGPPVLVRPAGHNRKLQVLVRSEGTPARETRYLEVDRYLEARAVKDDLHAREARERLVGPSSAEYDDASAIVRGSDGRRYRLPVVPGTSPVGRDIREVQSERSLAHIGNVFYEVPRGAANKSDVDFRRLRPVAAHRFAIHDFCTWRGLLVLAGALPGVAGDDHVVALGDTETALWLGCVDDLWKLGKPVGEGGPWKGTPVEPGVPSDPYVMTGFDRKTLRLSHDSDEAVRIRIEIDYSNRDFWKSYDTVAVPAGERVEVEFPAAYSAHWARLVADRACRATATFLYR